MPTSAYEYALNLLTARQYTSRNLRRKIVQKGFPPIEADETIDRLTANGILLVALFNGAYPVVWATTIIAIFGLLLSFSWNVVIGSVKRRADLWRKKARDLQDKLGVPGELAPWGEDRFYLGLQLSKSKWLKTKADDRMMIQAVDLAFYVLWAFVLIAAGGAAGLWRFP